jgi:hypothetical protein
LESIGAEDIVDGNPRLTLGLIWTIILRFQVKYFGIKNKILKENVCQIILLETTEINVGHKFLDFKKTEQKKFCKSSKFFVE